MTGPAFYVGPLGYLTPLDGVQRGAEVSYARPSSEIVTLGASRVVQVGARAPREWTLPMTPWSPPTLVAMLAAAAQGLLEDVWLLDVAAARANALPPVPPRAPVTRIAVPGFGRMQALEVGDLVDLPVLAGVAYRLSCVTTATAGVSVMTLTWRNVNGTTLSTVTLNAPLGTGAREALSASVVAPADTYSALVTVTAPAFTTTAPRLAMAAQADEFGDAGGFLPGEGTPCRVQVVDPTRTLQIVASGHGQADYTVTLREVGEPGL